MLNDDDLLSWRSLVPAAAVISLEVESSKRSVNSLHHLYKLGYIFVTCNFCTVPHVLYMCVLTLDLRWRKQIVSDIRYTGICLCIKQWSWTHTPPDTYVWELRLNPISDGCRIPEFTVYWLLSLYYYHFKLLQVQLQSK